MNAICERLIGTLRRELLDRTLILNRAHLRVVLAEYQKHSSTARPHQDIGQRVSDISCSRGHRSRPWHLPDPSKTCHERPDQRVRASRLKTEKAQVKSRILFRAAQVRAGPAVGPLAWMRVADRLARSHLRPEG